MLLGRRAPQGGSSQVGAFIFTFPRGEGPAAKGVRAELGNTDVT